MLLLLAVLVVGLSSTLSVGGPITGSPISQAETPVGSPLDEPLRRIAEARKVFQEVKDYSCVLIKRERINGQLTPNHVISLKVRNQPFAVSMRWLSPDDMTGREVCYETGKHGGKLRVHPNGKLGLLGWVTIDPKDPRAMKTTRHAITETGLGNLIERFAGGWEAERSLGQTQVRSAEYEYNKRRCTRVEVSHPAETVGKFDYFRTVVYFDKESKLPVRVECYDYPLRADDPGELIEVFSYVNLRVNIGLGEETFNH